MPQDDIVTALRTVAMLLTKYGAAGQARYVEDLARREAAEDPAFGERLGSVDRWGGSGAVWDVNLDPFHQSATHAEDQHGIGSQPIRERARFIAATFQQWDE